MICDALENLNRYRGLHKNLETAIDYLTAYHVAHDLSDLPLGRTEVDGENVFINVMEAGLNPDSARLEYHKKYADLQIDLTGSEHLGWASEGTEQGEFDEAVDCGFKSGAEHVGGVLGGGRFAIFFPGELHKPSCKTPGCDHVRKAVVKILMK